MNPELLSSLVLLRFFDYFIFEGFIKPVVANQGQKSILYILPILFDKLDPLMPDLIAKMTAPELRAYIKKALLGIDDKLSQKQVDFLIELWQKEYSPLQNANNIK